MWYGTAALLPLFRPLRGLAREWAITVKPFYHYATPLLAA
ncbi:hypothetical protein METHP14_30203 [Pseudomonas sp. P14-2025]